MNYFQIVRSALGQSAGVIAAARNLTAEAVRSLLKAHLQAMNDAWFSGQAPSIAYQDPLLRLSYLYCHVAVNANLFEHVIRRCQVLKNRVDSQIGQGTLKVCAFGGGPGTELLALSKYLVNERPGPPLAILNFTLIDRVAEWAETWGALEDTIRATISDSFASRAEWPFITQKTFLPADISRLNDFGNLNALLAHDVYALNYVVSEMIGMETHLANLLARMVQAAPSGAVFVVIDRDQPAVRTNAQSILTAAGLHVEQPQSTQSNMSSDEQSSVLQDWIAFLDHRPRVTWNAFYAVGVKP